MRIGANIPSLHAYNSSKRANVRISQASKRLSSGLKINSSVDDPSGLAIANKIRLQVKGLEKASENSSNAVSFIQTADGALTEISAMIQRIRELSVFAANDTNEDTDRQKVQDEINQLVQEIGDIPKKTEYNKIKMLNGECDRIIYTGLPSQTANATNVDVLRIGDSVAYGDLAFTVTAVGQTAKVSLINAANITFPVPANSEFVDQMFSINGRSITISAGDTLATIREKVTQKINTEPAIDIKTTLAATDTATKVFTSIETGEAGSSQKLTIGGNKKLVEALGLGTMSVFSGPNGYAPITQKGTPAQFTGLTSTLTYPISGALVGTSISIGGLPLTLENGDTAATIKQKLQTSLAQDTSLDLKLTFDANDKLTDVSSLNLSSLSIISITGDSALAEAMGFGTMEPIYVYNPIAKIGTDAVITIPTAATATTANGLNPLTTIYKAEGNRITILDRNNAEVCVDLKNASTFTVPVTKVITTKEGPLFAQVGANKDMGMYMVVPKISTGALEIDKIKVLDRDLATEAIVLSDRALSVVSKIRSKLGAYQNRLEHTVANLDNAYLDSSNSLSRIEDADMGREMTKYTKDQVIYQAAIAMIAQANQRPQAVLQLLQ